MNRALIFDCDGVLADTEPYGHLPAFNRMWREFDVPWQWTSEEYRRSLRIGGGKERMLSLFTEPEFLRMFTPPASEADQRQMIAAWHARKGEIYREILNTGAIPARPGVRRLIGEALDRGWLLAVASTSARESVEAVLHRVAGPELASRFDVVLAGDDVRQKKPAPDIYLLAAERLGVDPACCIAVEDSAIGVAAAVSAGMKCIVTVSAYTANDDFSRASVVLDNLGEPGATQCFTVADLERLAAQ